MSALDPQGNSRTGPRCLDLSSVPDDSDGIVTVQAGVWSENEYPNDRRHNFLFGDGGGSETKTGFNHAEVVYNERRFSSNQDPDPYSVNFYSGEDNPPMVNAQNWVQESFLRAN